MALQAFVYAVLGVRFLTVAEARGGRSAHVAAKRPDAPPEEGSEDEDEDIKMLGTIDKPKAANLQRSYSEVTENVGESPPSDIKGLKCFIYGAQGTDRHLQRTPRILYWNESNIDFYTGIRVI